MRYIVTLTAILSFIHVTGQPPVSDSSAQQIAVINAINRYHAFMGQQALIFNGTEHVSYDPGMKGFAYFEKDTLRTGSVLFDGVWYNDIALLYDIIADKLVISDVNGNLIAPPPIRIQRFLVGGHTFIQTPVRGYFDLLCQGTFSIQVKRAKLIEESTSTIELIRTAIENDHYYLVKDGFYYPVGSVNSLYSFMGDKKKNVRSLLRKNNIRSRKDKELALVRAAEYYNQLSR